MTREKYFIVSSTQLYLKRIFTCSRIHIAFLSNESNLLSLDRSVRMQVISDTLNMQTLNRKL